MNTTAITTRSDRPAAIRWTRTTTTLSLVLCWLLLAGAAQGGDEAGASYSQRPAAEPTVQSFVIKASSVKQKEDEAMAIAALRQNSKPGEALMLGGMTDRVERKLQFAYRLALERVGEIDTCAGLFNELGTDGIEMLSTTVYRPARGKRQLQVCSDTDAKAFTSIGSTRTTLCDSYSRNSRQAGAMILIHEALHHAGMSEQPYDPDALNSHQINSLVRRNCGL
jgi:hypothetical protein